MSHRADDTGNESGGLRGSIRALKHRNYRLLWTGNVISQTGDWMDQVAFSWLVYDMTGSTVALALVNVCRALPILAFTLMAGVIADRMDRRRMMVVSQIAMMVFAVILSLLLTFDALSLGLVFVIATARGIVHSFNQPARQALISELVPEQDLPSAVALNSTTFNLSKIFGPALSGVLIATVGVKEAFYINTASIAVALYTLSLMNFDGIATQVKSSSKSMIGDLMEGMRYLQREKALRTLVILALVPMVLGQPYQTMLTVFARDVFDAGSMGLGLLQSTAAIGAMVGIFFVASSSPGRFNLQMIIGLGCYGLALTLFAFSPSLAFALPLLLVVGLSQQTYQTSANTLLQLNVAPEYRGRVLSTLFLQRGMVPLGTMFAGFATTVVGPRVAIGGMAISLLVIAILAAPFVLSSLKGIARREPVPPLAAPVDV